MTDLSTLIVRLEAETSQYQQQLAAATKQLQAFQSSVAEVAQDLVQKLAAAFTVDKITEFVESAVESAAAMERLSQESGVAVEQLSSLAAVFAQAGVGQDEMSTSLKKLNQSISDAAGNATSKAAFAFEALGISVTNSNGSLKTAGELLPQIADAYSHLADGPNKVAINTDLLGRSALALIPTLNQGAAGLDALQQAAIDSGAALSGELAKSAEDLETKFTALKQSFTGTLSTQTLEAVIPTLNAVADGLAAIGKQGNSTSAIIDVFAGILKGAGEIILELEGELKLVGAALGGVEDAAKAGAQGVANALSAAFHLDAGAALSTLKSTGTNISSILNDESDQAIRIQQSTQDAITNLLQAGGQKQVQITEATAKANAAALSQQFDDILGSNQGISPAMLQSLDEGQKKVQQFAAALQVQADSFHQGIAAQTSYKLSTGALGDAVAAARKALVDFAGSTSPGTEALLKYAQATVDAAANSQKFALQLQTKIDSTEVTDFSDKLQEQVDKFALGDVAAVAYQLSVGKLGDALARAKQTLADLAAGTIPANATLQDLAQKTVDAATNAQKLSIELTNDKDVAPLQAVDQKILTLGEHLAAAAAAGFDFQNALLIKNVNATGDTAGQQKLATLKALTVAQDAYNELQLQYTRIQTTESQQEQAINDLVKTGQETELQGQADIAAARITELAQLGNIYSSMKTISDANATALPALVDKTNAANTAIKTLAASTNDLANKLRNDFEDDASSAFAAFVTGTQTASQALHSFVTDFETELVKMATKNLLQDILGGGSGGGGGGIFGALAGLFGGGAGNGLSSSANASIAATGNASDFDSLATALTAGGGLAGGGRATPGNSYTVGEHGAEEFVPDVPGTIVPNSKMWKGGATNIYVSIAAPQGTVSRQTAMQTAATVGDGVSRAQRRNR